MTRRLDARLRRLEEASRVTEQGPRIEVWLPDNGRDPDARGAPSPGRRWVEVDGKAWVIIGGRGQGRERPPKASVFGRKASAFGRGLL